MHWYVKWQSSMSSVSVVMLLRMQKELLVCVNTSHALSPAMRASWRWLHTFFICTSRLFPLDPMLRCCLFMQTSMP